MADKKISALTSASTPLAGTEVLPIVQSSSTVKVTVANLTAGRAVSASSVSTTGNSTFNTTANVGWTIGARSDNAISAIYSTSVTPSSTNYTLQSSASVTYLNHPTSTSLAVNDNAIATATATALTIPGVNIAFGTAAKGVNFTANTPAAGMTSQLLNWYEEGTWTPTVYGSSTAGTYTVSATARYTRIGRLVTATARITFTAASGGSGNLNIGGLPINYASGNAGDLGIVSASNLDLVNANPASLAIIRNASGSDSIVNIAETVDNGSLSLTQIDNVTTSTVINLTFIYNA